MNCLVPSWYDRNEGREGGRKEGRMEGGVEGGGKKEGKRKGKEKEERNIKQTAAFMEPCCFVQLCVCARARVYVCRVCLHRCMHECVNITFCYLFVSYVCLYMW